MDVANKEGIHFMVKESSNWDFPSDSLFRFAIDADACDGTNKKVAEGVDFSLMKLYHNDAPT